MQQSLWNPLSDSAALYCAATSNANIILCVRLVSAPAWPSSSFFESFFLQGKISQGPESQTKKARNFSKKKVSRLCFPAFMGTDQISCATITTSGSVTMDRMVVTATN